MPMQYNSEFVQIFLTVSEQNLLFIYNDQQNIYQLCQILFKISDGSRKSIQIKKKKISVFVSFFHPWLLFILRHLILFILFNFQIFQSLISNMIFAAFLIIFNIYSCMSDQLLWVQQTFNHGARYPLYPKVIDHTMYVLYENKIGQLTSQGKRMHYLLGRKLFSQYWTNLKLSSELNSNHFFVKSTNVNRTIQSAQSQIVGLFEKLDIPQITSNLLQFSKPAWNRQYYIHNTQGPVYNDPELQKYKAFPIHTQLAGSSIEYAGDFLYMFSRTNCPSQYRWADQNLNSGFTRQLLQIPKIREAILFMKKTINKGTSNPQPNDLLILEEFVDNYYSSIHLNKPIFQALFNDPANNYLQQFKFLHAITQYLKYSYAQKQIFSTITPYFNQTIKNIEKIISYPNTERFILYSTHQLHLSNLLVALDLTSADCIKNAYLYKTKYNCIYEYPGFASSIIFELWRGSQNYIKIRYNGNYVKIPFCRYQSQTCDYIQFVAKLKNRMRPRFLQDCDVNGAATPD